MRCRRPTDLQCVNYWIHLTTRPLLTGLGSVSFQKLKLTYLRWVTEKHPVTLVG
jgi:hypothetical protein